jgi:hypothetical protein
MRAPPQFATAVHRSLSGLSSLAIDAQWVM